MISGVIRKEITTEEEKLFFTPEILCQRLKSNIDRNKIFEITGNTTNFINFLLGSAIIQLFYYVGLRTDKIAPQTQLSTVSEQDFETSQKKDFLLELKEIISDFLLKEIELFEKKIQIELEIIKNAIDQRKNKINKEVILNKNLKFLHTQLISIFRNYPEQFFYDFVGKIMGISESIKKEVLKSAAGLKSVQMEIEKALKSEYEERFIELTIHRRIKNLINEKWEITVPKQLELQSVILHHLESDILKYLNDNLPFSENSLNAFLSSGEIKLKIIEIIKNTCTIDTNYDEFESSIMDLLTNEIYIQASKGPDLFLNFIANLLQVPLEEVIRFLNNHEITNVPSFCQTISLDIEDLIQKLQSNLISDSDLFRLSNKGPLIHARKELENLKGKGMVPDEFLEITLEDIFTTQIPITEKILTEICKIIKLSQDSLNSLILKEKILKQIIEQYNNIDIEQIRLSLKKDKIIREISRDILYSIMTNFLSSTSRIIEQYEKIKKDKEIFLIALKRIFALKRSEEWIKIKMEDLIINKIMERQKEVCDLVEKVDPFFINGFIWARLSNKTIKKALEELKENNSPIYKDVSPLPLSFYNIPPISYATAFDMCIRIEDDLHNKFIESEKQKEKEVETKAIESKAMFKDADTYSWIEKRIKMSIMRTGKIQPTQLYWKEEDSNKLSKILLLHSQIKKGHIICPQCGEYLISNKCRTHGPCEPKPASTIDNLANFYVFAMEKLKKSDFETAQRFILQVAITVLKNRIDHEPNSEDFEKMFDGEIEEIGKILGEDIGKHLNNLLYKNWRKTQLGR